MHFGGRSFVGESSVLVSAENYLSGLPKVEFRLPKPSVIFPESDSEPPHDPQENSAVGGLSTSTPPVRSRHPPGVEQVDPPTPVVPGVVAPTSGGSPSRGEAPALIEVVSSASVPVVSNSPQEFLAKQTRSMGCQTEKEPPPPSVLRTEKEEEPSSEVVVASVEMNSTTDPVLVGSDDANKQKFQKEMVAIRTKKRTEWIAENLRNSWLPGDSSAEGTAPGHLEGVIDWITKFIDAIEKAVNDTTTRGETIAKEDGSPSCDARSIAHLANIGLPIACPREEGGKKLGANGTKDESAAEGSFAVFLAEQLVHHASLLPSASARETVKALFRALPPEVRKPDDSKSTKSTALPHCWVRIKGGAFFAHTTYRWLCCRHVCVLT